MWRRQDFANPIHTMLRSVYSSPWVLGSARTELFQFRNKARRRFVLWCLPGFQNCAILWSLTAHFKRMHRSFRADHRKWFVPFNHTPQYSVKYIVIDAIGSAEVEPFRH